MQVKIIKGNDFADIENNLNNFLNSLTEDPKEIKYDFERLLAIVEFNKVDPNNLCCDCKFWDDGGKHDELIGLCQRCGGRKRFSDKCCNKFEDRRG